MDLQVLRVVILFGIAADFTRTEKISPGYVGCFKDAQDRTLTKKLSNSNTNTGSECMRRCKFERYSYRYAGTEHGNECFCSHDLHGMVVEKSECFSNCPGNRNEHCGGDWRLSVYDMWPEKTYTSSGYVGCYKDKDGPNRSLPRKLTDSNTNTGSECKRRCKSEAYRYAATEYGRECHCGYYLPGIRVQEWECYNTCPGNRNEHCGGYWRLSVYDTWPPITSTNRPMHHTTTHESSSSRASKYNKLTANTKPTHFDDSTTHTSSLSETTEYPNTSIDTTMFNGTNGNYNGSTTESRIAAGAEQKTVSSDLENHVTNELTNRPMHEATNHEPSSTILPINNQLINNTKPTFDDMSTTQTSSLSETTDIASASVATTICNGTNESYTGSTTVSKISTLVEKNTVTYDLASNVTADWVTINDKQFLVTETEETFFVAQNICSNLSVVLLSYSSPLKYFHLPSMIQLKLKSYWIGDIPGSECPTLSKTDTNTEIRLVQCSNINPFICSRTANNAKVEDDHEFAEMLKDMAVNVKETNKAKRKLISVEDRRRSAKFIGGTGIIIICSCVVCMVVVDINWKRCNCSKE